MRGLRAVCLGLGIANILAGLAAFPLGLGSYSSTVWLIHGNYRSLIQSGKVKEIENEDPHLMQHANELLTGLEQRSFNSAVLVFLVLGAQGSVLVGASLLSRSYRPRNPRTEMSTTTSQTQYAEWRGPPIF
jgi:hypothetical protein